MTNAESVLCTESLSGAHHIRPSHKGSPPDALPLPLGKEGHRGRVVCFPLTGFSFPSPSVWWCLSRLPETAGFHKEISGYSEGAHQDHNCFLQFFSKRFRWFSCSSFWEFHFTKIPTVLTIWVKARRQCYLLPAVSAWGYSFPNNCGCKFQCCQEGWSQVCVSKIQLFWVKSTSFHFPPTHHYKTTEMLNTNFFVKHIVLWTVKLMKHTFQLIELAIPMLISILSIPSCPLQQSLLLPPPYPVLFSTSLPSVLGTDTPLPASCQGSAPSALCRWPSGYIHHNLSLDGHVLARLDSG